MADKRQRGTVADARALQGTGENGACYLLHIEPEYVVETPGKKRQVAGRYVGWTGVSDDEDAGAAVRERYSQHVAGKGSPLIAAAVKAGHAVVIARVWPNVDRHFERAIKRGKNTSRLDPIVTGELTLMGAIEAHH